MRRTCHEYQQHKQAHSAPVSGYQNPLIQTNALSKSFQKKRSCGKCGRIHTQGQCPAHGKVCHSCGRKNHWTEMCQTRRNSSAGRTPSPHRPQDRQRRPSGGKPFKQQGGGGGKGSGKFFKKGTPNKHKKGGAPPKKTHSLKLVISEEENISNRASISGPAHPPEKKYSLSGPPHPPKEKYSLGTSHNNHFSNISGPTHPPKEKYSQPKSVPKFIIRHTGDTAYDSYIAETLIPLRSTFKPRKQDQVRERPCDQCQDTYQLDVDHKHQLPDGTWTPGYRLADTNRVVTSTHGQ